MEAIGVSFSNPLDEYELVQRIGSGTYGDVFKVRRLLRSPKCWLAPMLGAESEHRFRFVPGAYLDLSSFKSMYGQASFLVLLA